KAGAHISQMPPVPRCSASSSSAEHPPGRDPPRPEASVRSLGASRGLLRKLWQTPRLAKQRFRLPAQHVSFQPVVKARSHVRGFARHPTALLVQPVGPLVQPATRLVGVAELLIG